MDIEQWVETFKNALTLERLIDVLKRMKGHLQSTENYKAFCEGFLIPKEYLEPKHNETMITKVLDKFRELIPKDLLTF